MTGLNLQFNRSRWYLKGNSELRQNYVDLITYVIFYLFQLEQDVADDVGVCILNLQVV